MRKTAMAPHRAGPDGLERVRELARRDPFAFPWTIAPEDARWPYLNQVVRSATGEVVARTTNLYDAVRLQGVADLAQRAAEGMALERAHEIVGRCVARETWHMGLGGEEPAPLGGLTLWEIAEAHRVVHAAGPTPNGDGSSTVHVVCADRLVAAMFAVEHYDASDPGTAKTIAVAGGKGLVVVRLPAGSTAR